ncbi:unnamed protein product [Rangifer tarandus platyrhynchus]|uniref:Uncharacterized protein n=1 Tax=Rangifer tarandus platyrhynchus TaxID=3082113 RepID=A0ABN8XXG6_RANTA|nr:unnamed protein product [Rangifer tarandus platyrhynchus]
MFWAPGISFTEDNFSTDQETKGWFQDDLSRTRKVQHKILSLHVWTSFLPSVPCAFELHPNLECHKDKKACPTVKINFFFLLMPAMQFLKRTVCFPGSGESHGDLLLALQVLTGTLCPVNFM